MRYVNAGTVECLYQDGEFWFLEMNTRLQVEHCVTEEVTQRDLVAEQLRVASGEPLSFTAADVEHHGHSIECRINAEDPAAGFLPSPGTITHLRLPGGPGVRWDGGYAQGDTVSQHYDNLIGKLVVWGPDREAARHRMLRALGEFEISGLSTTIPAHVALLSNPDFAAVGTRRSGWRTRSTRRRSSAPPPPTTMLAADAEEAEPLLERTVPVEVDGKRYSVKLWLPEAAAASAAPRKRSARPRPGASGSGGAAGSGTISAPMQGTIVKVLVAAGDAVEAGQSVLVLEAMKMENHITAEKSGTVQEVRVAEGDTVGTGDVLLVIE